MAQASLSPTQVFTASSASGRRILCLRFSADGATDKASKHAHPASPRLRQVQATVSYALRVDATVQEGTTRDADIKLLAEQLQNQGVEVQLKSPSAKAAVTGVSWLGITRPYLVVDGGTGNADDDIIVDTALRSACTVGGQMTAQYAKKLAALPTVFVGTRAELRSRVNEMATAMALSLTTHGLSVPPWRSRKVLLQRWDLFSNKHACSSKSAGTRHTGSMDTSSSTFDDLVRASKVSALDPDQNPPNPAADVQAVRPFPKRTASALHSSLAFMRGANNSCGGHHTSNSTCWPAGEVKVTEECLVVRRESDTSDTSEDFALSPVSVLLMRANGPDAAVADCLHGPAPVVPCAASQKQAIVTACLPKLQPQQRCIASTFGQHQQQQGAAVTSTMAAGTDAPLAAREPLRRIVGFAV